MICRMLTREGYINMESFSFRAISCIYNTTLAQEYFPLDRAKAVEEGYVWKKS